MLKSACASLLFLASFSSASALSDTGGPRSLRPPEVVDLQRYLGLWYEVASIPQSFQKQCVSGTTAEYSFAEDGFIRVLNSCDTESGERSLAEGRARLVDSVTNTKLRVTFVRLWTWIFAFGGDYWIIGLDEDYRTALVGSPNKKYAWILHRGPAISRETLIEAERLYRSQGYDTCQILTSVQTGGFGERRPLCKLSVE